MEFQFKQDTEIKSISPTRHLYVLELFPFYYTKYRNSIFQYLKKKRSHSAPVPGVTASIACLKVHTRLFRLVTYFPAHFGFSDIKLAP